MFGMQSEIKALITNLKLEPHPEGGSFVRIFESSHAVKSLEPNRYNNEQRYASTSIYYLLQGDEFSAWHRLKSDEIWHFFKGSPVIVYVIDQEGQLQIHILGDPSVNDVAQFQVAIPADSWFAAEIIDKRSYALMGCTVSPGFEYEDFQLANRNELNELFPAHKEIIIKLTQS